LLSSERDIATSVVVVRPTAARSKSRPMAGKPVGKVTNGLCSAHLRERSENHQYAKLLGTDSERYLKLEYLFLLLLEYTVRPWLFRSG
jgi:hypothetical protein